MYYRPMHPALSSFIYVLSVFALFAQMLILSYIGSLIDGGTGTVVGFGVGLFIFLWIACWWGSAV